MNRLISEVEASVDLRFLKRCLAYVCVGAAVLLPLDWVRVAFQTAAQGEVQGVRLRESAQHQEELKPSAEGKDVFSDSSLFGAKQVQTSSPVKRSTLSDLAKDYHLKGVMLLGDPEAIIQDAKTQKTVFVKTGDSLGELKIKSIQEGRVTLEYLGEEKGLTIDG